MGPDLRRRLDGVAHWLCPLSAAVDEEEMPKHNRKIYVVHSQSPNAVVARSIPIFPFHPNLVRLLPNPSPEPLVKTAKQSIGWEYGPLHLAVSVATAAVGVEPHRVTKLQRSIKNSCGSSETVGDPVLLGRNESLPLPLGRGMRLARPILGPNGESIPVGVTARAHSHIRGKGSRVATRAGVREIG